MPVSADFHNLKLKFWWSSYMLLNSVYTLEYKIKTSKHPRTSLPNFWHFQIGLLHRPFIVLRSVSVDRHQNCTKKMFLWLFSSKSKLKILNLEITRKMIKQLYFTIFLRWSEVACSLLPTIQGYYKSTLFVIMPSLVYGFHLLLFCLHAIKLLLSGNKI